MTFGHLKTQLQERAAQGLLRNRICIEESAGAAIKVDGIWYVNFSSNDYLGVSQPSEELTGVADLAVGSGASPVVTGYSASHQQLTEYLCELTGYEDVLLFSSGFAANQTLCQTLMNQPDSLILADKLSHASLIDGALSAEARLKRFKHNDIVHLKALLDRKSPDTDTLVVTEGVFSMDGDQAPVADILALCREYGAWTMVDDAHGIGILGQRGEGSLSCLSDDERPEVLMATFGKAIGCGGAFVAAEGEVIEYLTNFARHYVYSTAFSPLQAVLTLQNLKKVAQQQWRRDKLQENICLFRSRCHELDIPVLPSDTAIQPVIVGDPERVMAFSESLKAQGHWVSGIRTPTVPKNTDRLRVTLTTWHEPQHIEDLVVALHQVFHGQHHFSDSKLEALG